MIKRFKAKKDLKKGQIITSEDIESIFNDEESLVDELVDYVELHYIDEVLDIVRRYVKEQVKKAVKKYKKQK